MIDIETESILTPSAACKEPGLRNPRTNKPCALSQFYRAVNPGARAIDGSKIRLEVVKLPIGICTTREAIRRFIAKLTDPDADIPEPTSKARQRQQRGAVSELEAAGFEIGG